MRKEAFKNADYPNVKAGNSNLYKHKLTSEERAIKQGWKFVDFQEKKPILLQANTKAFFDGRHWNIYETNYRY